jgi:hypothetical protein
VSRHRAALQPLSPREAFAFVKWAFGQLPAWFVFVGRGARGEEHMRNDDDE